jgi:hypothetical protein
VFFFTVPDAMISCLINIPPQAVSGSIALRAIDLSSRWRILFRRRNEGLECYSRLWDGFCFLLRNRGHRFMPSL